MIGIDQYYSKRQLHKIILFNEIYLILFCHVCARVVFPIDMGRQLAGNYCNDIGIAVTQAEQSLQCHFSYKSCTFLATISH